MDAKEALTIQEWKVSNKECVGMETSEDIVPTATTYSPYNNL